VTTVSVRRFKYLEMQRMASRPKTKTGMDAGRFVLGGALTLRTVEKIREDLLEMMQRHQALEIDCSAATEIDLSFVQLLLAARTSALSAGKTVALAHPASGILRDVLQRGGLLGAAADPGTADDTFWLQAARA
jgi:ABC-type transporter Mla MlaB component